MWISRRIFLASTAIAAVIPTLPRSCRASLDEESGHPVNVFEVTMAAPDIICVEIRDQEVTKGSIQTIPASSASYGRWTAMTNPATGLPAFAQVIGPAKTQARFADTV